MPDREPIKKQLQPADRTITTTTQIFNANYSTICLNQGSHEKIFAQINAVAYLGKSQHFIAMSPKDCLQHAWDLQICLATISSANRKKGATNSTSSSKSLRIISLPNLQMTISDENHVVYAYNMFDFASKLTLLKFSITLHLKPDLNSQFNRNQLNHALTSTDKPLPSILLQFGPTKVENFLSNSRKLMW